MFQALDLGVKTFGQGVGDPVGEIGSEIFEVSFEHPGNVFDRSQPTADRPAVPAIKEALMRTMPIQPQESCATADCLASLQHPNGKGFKHQRNAAVLAGPGYLDGFDTVLRAIDSGSACYQNRLKLHGVQVPPSSFRGVVVKGSPLSTFRTFQSPGIDLRSQTKTSICQPSAV